MARRRTRSRRRTTPVSSTSRDKPATPHVSRNSARARRRRALRRRRHMMMFRLFCCVLVCVVAVFATTVFFRVSRIEVIGDTRYDAQDLIDTSGVRAGNNMLFLDTDHVSEMLNQVYPYLNPVLVHKKLPSTLEIEVSDRVAVVSVETESGYLLVDITGKVLDIAADALLETAVVSGSEVDALQVGDTAGTEQEKLQIALDLMSLMTKYEMNTDVNVIDLSKAYDVYVQYANKYTILLGNMDDLEHKIQFLQAILKEPSLPESGIIDLTDDKEARYRPVDSSATPTEDTAEEDGESISGNTEDNLNTSDAQGGSDAGDAQDTDASQSTSDSNGSQQTTASAPPETTRAQDNDSTSDT